MFGINDFSKAIIDFGNFDFSQLKDALLFGGAMLLIGMATVFSVLCLLWLCLTLFKICFHDIPAKRSERAVDNTVVAAPVATAVSTNDDEIIAVIAAAIAMAESESSGIKFRVVSFRRK